MQPYRIDVPDGVLDDLRARLAITRWPVAAAGTDWDRGTDPDFLRELLNHWRTGYDWRRHGAELNELPHFKADGLHFVHQQAGSGIPVLLLHGWPDSFLRFVTVLPPQVGTADHVQRPRLHRPISDPPELLERGAKLRDAGVGLLAEVLLVAHAPQDVALAALVAELAIQLERLGLCSLAFPGHVDRLRDRRRVLWDAEHE